MKFRFFAISMLVLGMTLAGCSSTMQNFVAPGVENETRVAYGSSSVSNPDYAREFVVTPAPELAEKTYCDAALAYARNGLAALGMTALDAATPEALTVEVNYTMTTGDTRPRFDFVMCAKQGGNEAWNARTYCFGEAEKLDHYLPGLAAGALPLVGANRTYAAINLQSYQSYLEAVLGKDAPQPEKTDEPTESKGNQ